jgi:hypothetical protein
MAQAQGSKGRIGFLKEATWGTTPSVSAGDVKIIPFASETLSATRAKEDNPHITSSRNFGVPVSGRSEAGGDITFMLNPLAHAWILRGLLGAPVTTGAGPYVHTFKVPAALPSYSIEKGFTDIAQYLVYTGMTLSKLSLKVKDSGFVESTATFMGKARTASGTALDSAPTTYVDNPFALAAANIALTEGGGALAIGTEISLDIDNMLDGDNFTIASQGARGGINAGKCKVSGTLTAFFSDLTLFNKAKNSTESAIVITLQHGTGAGSAGNEKLVITIPEIVYSEADPQIGDSGGVLVALPFTAYYADNANATSLMMELYSATVSLA